MPNFFFKFLEFYFHLFPFKCYILSGEGLTNISSAVESGLGLPTPEELVKNQWTESPANASVKVAKVVFILALHFIFDEFIPAVIQDVLI